MVAGAKGAQAGGHLREAAALQRGQAASEMGSAAKGAQVGGHLREAAAFQRGQAASTAATEAKGAQTTLQEGKAVGQAASEMVAGAKGVQAGEYLEETVVAQEGQAASKGGLSAPTTISTKTKDILVNPKAFRGASMDTALMEIEKQIPADWIRSSINKGEGIKWVHPANNGESIMLEFGNSAAKDVTGVHKGPYLRVTRHGKVTRVPLEGNPALNLNVE